MPWELLFCLVVLAAAFTQGATGFGFGLVVMSVLPHVVEVQVAVPVVAVLAAFVSGGVLWRWRRHVDLRKVGPILPGTLIGTPLGVLFLTSVDSKYVTAALGVVLVVWGGSRLVVEARGGIPPGAGADHPGPGRGWGLLAGAVGGVIGGAFNTGGPPVILYATARRWDPAAFKANLQVVFLLGTVFQLSLLIARGLVTREVLLIDLVALPAVAVGLYAGTRLSRRLDPVLFRRIVLALLVLFGGVYLVRSLGLGIGSA